MKTRKTYENNLESMKNPIIHLYRMVEKKEYNVDYGGIKLSFVFQDTESSKSRVSNYCDHSYNYSTNPQPFYLANFCLTCQWNTTGENKFKPYAFSFSYRDIFFMDEPEKLESMAKTLKKITVKLHTMNEEEGYTDNFAEWVVRICKIINCQWGIIPDKASEDSYWLDEKTYLWFNLGEIRSMIESELKNNQHKQQVLSR